MQGLDDSKPIYLQIKERIEEQIVGDQLQEEDQIPSTTQLVQFYKINHLTVAKGIQLLVDEGVLYKKRGLGTFVVKGAKQKLLNQRREVFVDQYIAPMLREAAYLGIAMDELIQLMKMQKGGGTHELRD